MTVEKWKTVKSDYIYKTPFGNLRDETCELPDGQKIEHYYVQECPEWINAVVITKERQMVFVKQYRQAIREIILEIPGGKAEPDESLEDAIIREVKEETGYVSDHEPIELGKFDVNPATNTNSVTTFLFQDAYTASEQDLDATEDIEIETINVGEIEALIKERHLTQLFSAHAYLLAKEFYQKAGEPFIVD